MVAKKKTSPRAKSAPKGAGKAPSKKQPLSDSDLERISGGGDGSVRPAASKIQLPATSKIELPATRGPSNTRG